MGLGNWNVWMEILYTWVREFLLTSDENDITTVSHLTKTACPRPTSVFFCIAHCFTPDEGGLPKADLRLFLYCPLFHTWRRRLAQGRPPSLYVLPIVSHLTEAACPRPTSVPFCIAHCFTLDGGGLPKADLRPFMYCPLFHTRRRRLDQGQPPSLYVLPIVSHLTEAACPRPTSVPLCIAHCFILDGGGLPKADLRPFVYCQLFHTWRRRLAQGRPMSLFILPTVNANAFISNFKKLNKNQTQIQVRFYNNNNNRSLINHNNT